MRVDLVAAVLAQTVLLVPGVADMQVDPRNIGNGYEIGSEGYCDQPFVVQTDDGGWLCVMTTGKGIEGEPGQHVVAVKSFDRGETWGPIIPIEPADGPESSWAVPLKVPSGRVYCFYTYNGDNLRECITDFGPTTRVDTLGYYAFKYSDDNGLTWSDKRWYIPVRKFKCDLENPYKGEVMFFWGVSKPITVDDVVYFGFSKVGRFGHGFMTTDEGAFMMSDNIVSESDPDKIRWETLPDGDVGLKSPKGPISDEHNLTSLSDGSLFCTFRTTEGHNCCSYSRDGGHTWTQPVYCSYTPDGKLLKHPRAANFVRKYSNGKFTLWFHNHGGRWYEDRNPAWVVGGIEKDGHIHWSQPEVWLYDDDPDNTRISYPDFIEEDGKVYITETQKRIARVHEVDPTLLEGIWRHDTIKEVSKNGLAMEWDVARGVISTNGRNLLLEGSKEKQVSRSARKDGGGSGDEACEAAMPDLGDLRKRGGFSIELWGDLGDAAPNAALFDSRAETCETQELKPGGRRGWGVGEGLLVRTVSGGAVEIVMNDGRTVNSWRSDLGLLTPGKPHHVVITVDAGPRIITFIVDGVLCNGGEERQYGWGRFSPYLGDVTGSDNVKMSTALSGVRVYARPLRTFEAVGNWRASSE